MKFDELAIGPCRIICADCRDVLPTLGKIDLVLTDPPYGINLRDNSQGGRHGRKRTAWEYGIEGDETQDIGTEVLRWCEANKLPTIAFASPRLPWPGKWSSLLVWDKGGAVGGGGDVQRCWKQTWEMIQVARITQLRISRDVSVLRFHVLASLSANHPAAKPVDLISYLIRQTSDKGQIILDPFGGSMTTGVSCINLDRRCILIEKERKYFDAGCKRIERAWADRCNRLPFDAPQKELQPDLFSVV